MTAAPLQYSKYQRSRNTKWPAPFMAEYTTSGVLPYSSSGSPRPSEEKLMLAMWYRIMAKYARYF
ncbi:hypothetical protein D3C72_2431980 [compost metagenome]